MEKSELTTGRCMSLEAMHALYDLRENNQLCDATIVLENGTEVPIHSALFCACSTYFRAYFTTPLRDKKETKIKVAGVSADVMHTLINYVYLRKLDLNENNANEILIASDYLGILGALDMCCRYLEKILNPNNCFGILTFARNYCLKDLEDTTWKYIMKNFSQIYQESEEILKLPLDEFRKILSSDTLNVKSEEMVWDAILRWIDFDKDSRKKDIVVLLNSIRLGLLDTQFFLERVKDHSYVTSNEGCRPIVIETLKFLYDLERIMHKYENFLNLSRNGEVLTPALARPRIPHEVLFVIGGWSGGSPTNFIETYDTRADRWIKVEEVDPAGPRAYHGTVVIGYNIYVVGGFDGMDYFNSCRCFNPITKVWKEVAPMHARRCYVSVAVLGDLIYAMGGYDGHHRQNTAEKYDYRTNQWSVIASMNMQRSDASACSLDGKIYITGGFNGQECMHSAEVYDPDVNQWTLIAAMRSRRSGVSCIAYHGCVYVVGGFNGISRMCSGEKYTPATNTWTPIPDMYNPRSNFAIEVADDMIFVIGGFNGVTTIYHVECYDDKSNEWYEATDMNIYRSALSACVVDGLPNVNDYIHKHRDKLMEEKRQKMLALESQRNQDAENIPIPPPLNTAAANLQHLNIVQHLNNNNNNPNNNENNEVPPAGALPIEADDVNVNQENQENQENQNQ